MSADQLVSIGQFSKMTFLSVKTLRHYHDEGLLEPARIDPATGYRFYEASQIATAQVIRRFRDLDLPIGRLRDFLDAPDEAARNAVIVEHLDRMSAQLHETQATVESLRRILTDDGSGFPVSYRSEPEVTTLAIAGRIASADVVAWWLESFRELHRTLRSPRPSAPAPTACSSPRSSSPTTRPTSSRSSRSRACPPGCPQASRRTSSRPPAWRSPSSTGRRWTWTVPTAPSAAG